MSCDLHPGVTQICPACLRSIPSQARADASRSNGRSGGRPRRWFRMETSTGCVGYTVADNQDEREALIREGWIPVLARDVPAKIRRDEKRA